MVRYLGDVGEVIWFEDEPSLRDVVVVDPRWLCTDIIGPLLAPSHFAIKKASADRGRVPYDMLESVFKGQDVGMIVRLLRKLHLCFPETEADPRATLMFPAALKGSDCRPEGVWQRSSVFERYFGRRLLCKNATTMFTAGFFPKIQVRIA